MCLRLGCLYLLTNMKYFLIRLYDLTGITFEVFPPLNTDK